MKQLMTIRFIMPFLLLTIACFEKKNTQPEAKNTLLIKSKTITNASYELILPNKRDHLLILFPCFPCDAQNTRTEFDILNAAIENNIAVLLMNFNQHLWLSTNEKEQLHNLIADVILEHDLTSADLFIGGFSSGGNVALLLTDFLKLNQSFIQPDGLFIVDSPIDLLALYESAQKTIERNYSKPAIQEALWIVNAFEKQFGKGDSNLVMYEEKSPYISRTHSIKNISHLDDVEIRLYSEPDTLWWKKNRKANYQDMNAYYIELLSRELSQLYGQSSVKYIETNNKGYRVNGERHPHSWSIVDPVELVEWIKENSLNHTEQAAN